MTYKTNILDVLEEDGNVRFELDVKKKGLLSFHVLCHSNVDVVVSILESSLTSCYYGTEIDVF